jgi:hypothetical protein
MLLKTWVLRVPTLSGVQGQSPWWGTGATPQCAAGTPSLARGERGGPGGGRGLVAMHGPFPPLGSYGVDTVARYLTRCPIDFLPGVRHDAARPATLALKIRLAIGCQR